MEQVRSSHRGSRETSPDRAKICRLKPKVKPARKVQVVYYLSRNGLLEHPHFMELTLLPNQPLRLKDVFDRLMILRGSGMPLQYSWSSKRNYKSGYVWYDLALKDIIYPSEGGEYVLKGSELVEGCSERFQQLNVSNKQGSGIHEPPETNFVYNAKNKVLISGRQQQQKEVEEYEEYEEQEEEKEFTSSTTTPHSRCSRGVSTEELGEEEDRHENLQNNTKTEKVAVTTTNNRSSRGNVNAPPPKKNDSAAAAASLAEKLNQRGVVPVAQSKRFGGETGTESAVSAPSSRYSALLQLIACGSSGAEFKARQQEPRVSNVGTTKRESVDRRERDQQKVVMLSCDEEEEEEEAAVMVMMNRVSENPRLMKGNLQTGEEKEYFSGSLVESMKANQNHPVLKRSNSYNEERKSKLGMEEVKLRKEMEAEKGGRKGGVKEKCIPLKKSPKESRRW